MIGFFPLFATAQSNSPVGFWQTKDDEGSDESAIIEISVKDQKLQGRIVELINTPTKDPVCVKCTGDKKDQPIQGLQIIWNLEPKAEKWTNGFILDPKSGKEYRCSLQLKNAGEELHVRGYIGFALIGRSQIWKRVQR